MVLGNSPIPSDLHVITMLPRLPALAEYLSGWLNDHQNARLVIVDVLRKVRPLSDGKGNAYNEDYDTLALLKDLADKYQIAVVVVHHTRKMTDDADVLNEVSGSTGLTGAADTILIAKRARNTADAVLHLTGRDVSEREYGMSWDVSKCMWTLLDEPVALATMGATRRTILLYLTEHQLSTPQAIATGTGLNFNTVKSNVRRMVEDDQLDSDGRGRYLPRATATPATHATGNGDAGARVHSLESVQPALSQVTQGELQRLHELQVVGDE
jgi:hypothetical protein